MMPGHTMNAKNCHPKKNKIIKKIGCAIAAFCRALFESQSMQCSRRNRQMDLGLVNSHHIFYHFFTDCAVVFGCCWFIISHMLLLSSCPMPVTPFRKITHRLRASVCSCRIDVAFVKQIWFGLTLAHVAHTHTWIVLGKNLGGLSTNLNEKLLIRLFATNVSKYLLSGLAQKKNPSTIRPFSLTEKRYDKNGYTFEWGRAIIH